MNVIEQYLACFQAYFPAHSVRVKPKRVRGELKFSVLINGDAGDLLLSEADLRSAIRMFNRGK